MPPCGGEDPQDAGKGYSRVTLEVTAGQTYLIQVSGVASSIGSFHLDLKEFPTTQQSLATQDLAPGRHTRSRWSPTCSGRPTLSVQVVPGSVDYTGAPNASGLFSGGSGILDSREGGTIIVRYAASC